ncbi:hypothetical protein [Nostoc sp. C117]|uniref:hypothetical protein n=1 Tax=Nostoc sp. C117 TaxID=3349875 RepID=UPI00370DB104
MEVDLHKLKEYLELLCELEEGDEIHFGERIVRRMDGRIWESIFIVEEEEYINEEDEDEV